MADAGLRLENLTIAVDGKTLIDDLSAHILPGETLSIMGPSGVGKTTLLAAITGTLAPKFQLQGGIWLNGQDLCPLKPQHRGVGFLFQDHLLFPHLSVGENLAFGLSAKRNNRRQRVENALAEIDLAGFADRDPATLSGGQRARVALMRTLLAEPEVLLLDEPFSRLDATLRKKMRELVFGRARKANLPVLLVTHDIDDVNRENGTLMELPLREAA